MQPKTARIGAVGLGGESVFLTADHFHAPGETLCAESIFIEPGGKAYNQAVAAARLGAQVCFFGAVGSDPGGALCRDVLLREGVTPILQTVPEANTAYACILTDRRGENQVTVYRGAADLLSADFLRAKLLCPAAPICCWVWNVLWMPRKPPWPLRKSTAFSQF